MLRSGSSVVVLVALGLTVGACAPTSNASTATGDDGTGTTTKTASTTTTTKPVTTTGLGGHGGSAGGSGQGGQAGGSGQGGATGGSGQGGHSGGSGQGGQGGAGGVTGQGGTGGVGGQTGQGGSPADLDQDGDGWTPNQGDCCDTLAGGNCGDPALVNPGAFEYPGNGVDDDCDPSTKDDVPFPDCSGAPLATPTSAMALVHAMDLCQQTSEAPPLEQKKWGVIRAELLLADGSQNPGPKDVQVGVLASYGPNVKPLAGTTMAALSSGTARVPGDPGYVHPQNGKKVGQTGNFDAGTQCGGPPDYIAAHGGLFPSPANCSSQCQGQACNTSYDSVNLKTRIRVPTNAKSFSYRFKFYSAEYPEFLCRQYNDFFVTLLSSSWLPDPNANPPEDPLPTDKNIAFDANKNPVSVNNAFFQICFPVAGQPGSCPSGTLELVGTGMGGWDQDLTDGGGTVWLTNDAPVVPGETIELEFVTWDAGDHNVDSLVLLDKFRWNITPSSVGTHK
jgi:hypothetical protein